MQRVGDAQEPVADRDSALSSYGRRLHQGRAGAATGVPDPLQWWYVSTAMYRVVPVLSVASWSPRHFNLGHQLTMRTAVQHCSV